MSSEQDENQMNQPICTACKQNLPDPSFSFPLCQKCRSLLINRPYPIWVRLIIVIIGCMLLYSFLKFPTTLKAGNAQKAGKMYESHQNYTSAIIEYRKILAIFPQSHEHKARLAICLLKSGEVQQAIETIKTIDDDKLSKDVISELNLLISQLTPANTNDE